MTGALGIIWKKFHIIEVKEVEEDSLHHAE